MEGEEDRREGLKLKEGTKKIVKKKGAIERREIEVAIERKMEMMMQVKWCRSFMIERRWQKDGRKVCTGKPEEREGIKEGRR